GGGVALLLPCREDLRLDERIAAVAPEGEAAGQRGDVLVAELLPQCVRPKRRSLAGCAIEHEALAAVGLDPLDPRLEIAAGNVDGAGNVSLLELALLTHVDEREGGVGAAVRFLHVERLLDLRGIDLFDPFAGLSDQLLP